MKEGEKEGVHTISVPRDFCRGRVRTQEGESIRNREVRYLEIEVES